jgi:hypothetical protein
MGSSAAPLGFPTMRLFQGRRSDGERPDEVPGYRDLTLLGHGGFSVVYRANQEALDRAVALKVLTVPLDDDARRRFFREVKTTARLTGHPNVVTALDAGRTGTGRPFLAMDLYHRGSLMDRLNTDGPLPATEVARIGAKIADALAAAHEVGIVHRDVKPSNILVSRFGEPALADFGVACLLDAGASSTVLATFTPSHAAPEVVNREPPSAASDIYALGSTMYQLVAGRTAFGGEAIAALLHRILTEEPAELDCPDLPALAGIVRRCMAKRPADRYPGAAALAAALRGVLPGAEPTAPPPTRSGSAGGPHPGAAPAAPAPVVGPAARADTPVDTPNLGSTPVGPSPSVWDTTGTRRPRHAVLTVAGVLVALTALTAGLLAWQRYERPEARAQPRASSTSDPGVPAAGTPAATTAGGATVASGPAAPPAALPGNQPPPGANPPQAPPGTSAAARPQPPSSAAQKPTELCTPDGCAARATFVPEGDHLYVCDNKADGHSAMAWYQRSDVPGQNNEAWDNNGAGTCIDHNMNMPEGTKITFRVCIADSDNHHVLVCSNTVTTKG